MAVWAIFNNVDCAHCNDQIKEIRGCVKPLASPKIVRVGNETIEFDRCPQTVIKGNIAFFIEAYGFYKNGYLPNAGTWLDQPIKLLQAFNVIGEYIDKLSEVKDGRGKS